MRYILIILAVLLLAGCGDIKVDGSTQKTYRESIQDMKDNLPIDQSQNMVKAINSILFEEAVTKYNVDGVDIKTYMLVASSDNLPKILNGKTANEIIEMGRVANLKTECDSNERLIDLIYENISIYESTLNVVSGYKAKEIQEKIDEANENILEAEKYIDKNCH